MQIIRYRYDPAYIIDILDRYQDISSGAYTKEERDTDYSKSESPSFKANFENSIIAKSDIDMACDKLSDTPGKWLKWCHDITQSAAGQGLSQRQYIIARYIQGFSYIGKEFINIIPLAKELAAIA